MFKSVVSTQDLLSDSQRSSTYSGDSALFSLSQRQQSQNDFSQVRTQDLFTQNPNTGSQSESSFPSTRKVSMYDKWMSKGAMFRKDAAKAANSQASYPGMNKARDSEDRDFMQQVVNIVQDCNKEVKNTLTAVKETLESQSEQSGEKLTDTMKAFLEDLWKHEDRMLKAVEEGKQMNDKHHDLDTQLAAKEALIQQLQARLEEKNKLGDVKQVAKAVRQEMLSPHLTMENKLMEILEVTREASEQHNQQLTQYQSQVATQARDLREWRAASQKMVKDMEKRLQKDILGVRREVQKEEEEWRGTLHNQLLETCGSHAQDMEQLIERAISDCTTTLRKQGPSSNTDANTIISSVKKELQTLLQKQTKTTEKSLQALWQQQASKQQRQLNELHQTIMAAVTEAVQAVTDHFQGTQDADMLPLTVPAFEEKIDHYHSDIKQQLEEMHQHHMDEVKRLQNDAPRSVRALTSASTHDPFSLQNQADPSVQVSGAKAREYPLQRRTGVARITPLSQQARASLFSRAKPSPIVAVLPQQQTVNTSLKENNSPVDSDSEVIFQPLADKPKVTASSKKRKGGGGRKKGGVKKKKGQGVTTDPPTCSKPKKVASVQQLAVYDFADDQSPDQSRQLFHSFQWQNGENQRNELCSPSASTESCLSSPAVSVTVDTELVWVRRSRWSTRADPTLHIQSSEPRKAGEDMLSSPFLTTSMAQRPLPRLKVEKDHSQLSWTRSGVKRLL